MMTTRQQIADVVVLSSPETNPWPGFGSLESSQCVVHTTNADELKNALPGAPILVVTDFNTSHLQAAWPAADSLEWIHATSAGVDVVLIPEVVESEVIVTNARGFFDAAIAEYVAGLALTFAKDFHGTRDCQREHRWNHRDSERLTDKRMLIVGAGSIGCEIARVIRCLGMEVEGIARTAREDTQFSHVYGEDQLMERLPHADYVVISAPLTDATRGLFDHGVFSAMKTSARLINIGRGEIVRTQALVEALENEEIAGAALDVFECEPLPSDHPLWKFPQVIVSPHMAGDFVGWREALSKQFIDNFHRRQRGEDLFNVVDKSKGYVGMKS
ncbi:MAG: D-2-hydroxyacid dehydrogenase [Candidatus Omnitrophica bacterium]|nr:D-2-hydroxyacid dehydrogenase [Candidatus Omnitrophota bacterium]